MNPLPISDNLHDEAAIDFRTAVRGFVAARVAPLASKRDAEEIFPADVIQELGSLGYLGILIPEEDGGSGGRLVDYAILIEELAYGCGSTSTAVMTQVHAMLPPLFGGSPEQRRRWIPQLCDGGDIGAFGLTEPEAGSDVMGITTRAVRTGDAYSLTGAKTFITNGSVANKICVFARTAEGRDGLTAFLVDGDSAGLSRGRPFAKLGLRASDTSELFLDDVEVGVVNRLGDEGDGWRIAMSVLDVSRISTAAQSVGLARYALDRAVAHSNERRQFGRPIGELQAVRLRLAEMFLRVEQARSALYALVAHPDAVSPMTAGAVKVMCSDTAMWVTTEAIQAFGGAGYLTESGVERGFRDAKATQIYDGTNDINRLIVARELLREAS